MGFNLEKELNKKFVVETDNSGWKSIGNLDANLKTKRQTPIGVRLLDLKVSVFEFSKMVKLSHVLINRLVTYGSDITAVELVLACRYLGLSYDESYEKSYNIYNKQGNLLHYICKVNDISKSYLFTKLGIKMSELDILMSNIDKVSHEQLEIIKEVLGLTGDSVDLGLCVYDLFRGGDYKLLDKYLLSNKLTQGLSKNECKSENKTSITSDDIRRIVVSNKGKDVDGIVVKCNTNKDSYIKVIHNSIKGIIDILNKLDADLGGLDQNVSKDKDTVEISINEKVETEGIKTKDDDNAVVGLGRGMYKVKGTYDEEKNKRYSAFYTIRTSKGLSLEDVSKATGIKVKELLNLEGYDYTHNNVSCGKLREYYGIDKDVYLDGVTDKLRLLGYLLMVYNVNISKYANTIGIGSSTLYKLKYKRDLGSEEVDKLIKYLKKTYDDVDARVEDYKRLTKK